ncbi:uncharacterized protein hdly isoform X2 [Ochlerotatus camptorhynchus]|uniref:uncharacterized protein hdly isoform X2 n=1 Tax=Ochlerotatus camptorhynchus TaxID=644619 RepID=UPI0031D27DA9
MRLSSSSSSAGFYSLVKRNPVASIVVSVCVCMLLPLVAGVREPEIDLKTANHGQDLAHGVSMDAKYARIATSSGQHDSAHSRKNKPNKSSLKKYVEDSSVDQHGKEKKSIYDKKYFDYIPAELKDPLDAPTDVSLAKRTNCRRFRRDADGVELRTKRNGPWPPYSERGYSYQVPMIYPGSMYLHYDPNNNYRPHLNNQYLPPVVFTPVPQQPDRTYLPPVTQRPQPTEPPGMFDPGNRIGDSGPNVFAFDTLYDPNVETDYRLIPGRRPSTGNDENQVTNNVMGRPITTVRPLPPRTPSTASTITTTTPRSVIQHNSDDDFDWSTLGLSPDAVGSRLGVDGGGINDNTLNSMRREPSKCTWAIANCCSQFSDKIRYYCFEQNQCFGAFWGDNVCRGYYRLALAEIENYYNV